VKTGWVVLVVAATLAPQPGAGTEPSFWSRMTWARLLTQGREREPAGAASRADSALSSVAAAAPGCPGHPPPPVECSRVICNVNDLAWEYEPLPAGTLCRQTTGQCDGQGTCVVQPPPVLADRPFYIRSLGRRCLDFGGEAFWTVGAPVFVYGCNGSVAQQVRIKEIDAASHDVELRVRDQFCLGVRGGQVTPGQPLELQRCDGSPAQRFATDGDAILMGIQAAMERVSREYVIEPEQGRTPDRTRLVVGSRDLSDAEYFRFQAVDGSDSRPTSGFVRAPNDATLGVALSKGWGTVIEVDDLVLYGGTSKRINAGVTLRGYRKFTDQGPEIVFQRDVRAQPAFLIEQSNVRVTGLRLRGRAGADNAEPYVSAIQVTAGPDARVLLDHLDISYWTGSAIEVTDADHGYREVCPDPRPTEFPRKPFARAVGNFLHHNHNYGVVSGGGAFAMVQANVLYQNAHDIAGDCLGDTGYAAYDNLVLTPAGGSQNFDVHGCGHGDAWYGGIAGDAFDIGWNTFLPTARRNFHLRGTPCRVVAFHHNLTQQSQQDAIKSQSEDPAKLVIWANTFDAPNPLLDLAVGDFDGDRVEDVFVGTGVAWYFSSGGQAEWRFLNRISEHASQVRFGDFDGDGRTDVLALHGANLDVSWGGVSSWQTINVTAWALADLAVGDFDGDGHADLFLATGSQWFYAPGGRNWTSFATSGFRTPQLRFGDFDGDGKTDVLGVVSGKWQIVRGGTETWEPLRSALSALVDVVVADFDGDGVSDVARTVSGAWRYSRNARSDWVVLRSASEPLTGKPVGRFDGNGTADVILWDGLQFNYAPGGRNPVARLSRQVMR
jgi:FG-GAP-like repeat/Ricin-type beta-trefoil lectin domain